MRSRPFRPRLEALETREVPAAPGDAPPLPPPPPPSATVIHVDTVAELEAAVANLQSGQTVVVQPGTYQLTRTLYIGKDRPVQNVTIRGATNNFNDVVIKGLGMDGRRASPPRHLGLQRPGRHHRQPLRRRGVLPRHRPPGRARGPSASTSTTAASSTPASRSSRATPAAAARTTASSSTAWSSTPTAPA